jgi:hypothetical protein
VTQWVENPELGRERGPVGLLRAWVELLGRPRSFFGGKVAPGDQAPGLTFAAAVILVAEGGRIAVGGTYPVAGGQPTASAVLWVLLVTVLVTPAGIHLTAALQTLVLMATVEDRAGVGETVQVICYALAPCVFLWVPSVWVQSAVVLWGVGLLVVGTATVHDIPLAKAVPVVAVPALVAFGYGLGGNDALLAAGRRVWDALAEIARA